MAKRKRQINGENALAEAAILQMKSRTDSSSTTQTHIQIITGTYDRILHGMTTCLPSSTSPNTTLQFSDTFLLESHLSSLTCLALSPPSTPVPNQPQKLILATGSTDSRINLYHISAHPPSLPSIPIISRTISENPTNRTLGTLTPHPSSITSLTFPSRSKLLSSAEDSTICITRTRDWTTLGSIKAPIPKADHRPSGDTAEGGRGPSGVVATAVHASGKIMLSVGKGERCLRLWNLVTGKKAGVLGFERGDLEAVGEGRRARGEGRSVVWGTEGMEEGDEFAVGFERGVLVFGMDSKVRCRVVTDEKTKLHRIVYVGLGEGKGQVLAVSTEDGRVLFFSTNSSDLIKSADDNDAPKASLVAQLGGKAAGITGRIKDFEVLKLHESHILIITGSSDGNVRVWKLSPDADLDLAVQKESGKQVGELLGTYETGNRITCLVAFLMLPRLEGTDEEGKGEGDEDEFEGLSGEEVGGSSESEIESESDSDDSDE